MCAPVIYVIVRSGNHPGRGLRGVILGWHRSRLPINYQRQAARAEATRKWEERRYASPRTSLAYRTPVPGHPTENCTPSSASNKKDGLKNPSTPNEKALPTHWQQKQREQPCRRYPDSSQATPLRVSMPCVSSGTNLDPRPP
jgi:hypothetical protein